MGQTLAQYEVTMLFPSFSVKQHCSPVLQSLASSQAITFLSPHDGAHAASPQPSPPQQNSSPTQVAFPQPIDRVDPSLASGVVCGSSLDEHATSPMNIETASPEEKRSTPRAYHRVLGPLRRQNRRKCRSPQSRANAFALS